MEILPNAFNISSGLFFISLFSIYLFPQEIAIENKLFGLFCAMPVAIVFCIYLCLLCNDNVLYFVYMTT